ncbi:MAG: hypothetical protein M3Y76_06820, partial [Chloroflexota bacterium]|nr:hypothetical protein [Chloroflexota bacterium]
MIHRPPEHQQIVIHNQRLLRHYTSIREDTLVVDRAALGWSVDQIWPVQPPETVAHANRAKIALQVAGRLSG